MVLISDITRIDLELVHIRAVQHVVSQLAFELAEGNFLAARARIYEGIDEHENSPPQEKEPKQIARWAFGLFPVLIAGRGIFFVRRQRRILIRHGIWEDRSILTGFIVFFENGRSWFEFNSASHYSALHDERR